MKLCDYYLVIRLSKHTLILFRGRKERKINVATSANNLTGFEKFSINDIVLIDEKRYVVNDRMKDSRQT